ncbi:ABC transporter substrate-binding protein [uncultured Martelella sp.]|uniref:ABC transporter substrate-binding protein n=1 Tax=uncultured Martelella sp. TaxID=392331 RepID=UPI0029C8D7C8|nr:ABC transporter substrate-binding protein [uncultured Martelella sp.]
MTHIFAKTGSLSGREAKATLLAAGLFLAALAGDISGARADEITVTDVTGHTVTLDEPAERIILPEGRHILTLALLDPDPAAFLVGWGNDLKLFSPETFDAVHAAFPEIDDIPDMGNPMQNSLSIESMMAAKPDLVIFTLYGRVPTETTDKLEAAGIPYMFVDFFQKPLENTVPSMRQLGQLLGREEQAEEFISFYESHMDEIADRLAENTTPTSVFFHLNPDGENCCYSSGPGNMSDFIAAAGGRNIGEDRIPGPIGQLSLEYILAEDPDFYLAGGGSTVSPDGLKVGTHITRETAAETLAKVTAAPGISELTAVKDNDAAGIWLFFFDNPLFFLGVEEMATLFHPDLFADVDPDETLAELNERFLPFDLEGTFWIKAGAQSN